MATYIIGDVQGCMASLETLLAKIGFSASNDRLWFVGDLVNRGPDSLGVLRFVHSLGDRAVTVLGNHDLHLLAVAHIRSPEDAGATLQPVLNAPDAGELLDWLRQRPVFHFDADLNWAMVHAAVHPGWSVQQTAAFASEISGILRSADYEKFFDYMYGDRPSKWDMRLTGHDRLRFLVNLFTRARYMRSGALEFDEKRAPGHVVASHGGLYPWFTDKKGVFPGESTRLAFGHWSTLPSGQYGNVYATDGGCLWGGKMVALQIEKNADAVWHTLDCSATQRPGK